jgi:hypothetical protein
MSSDPRLRDVVARLEEYLAPYDPETDFLPHESGSAHSSKFANWSDLVPFVAEAAAELESKYRVPDLASPKLGKSGEHGESDYRKTRLYGKNAGPSVGVSWGETEGRDGMLHETWHVNAALGGLTIAAAEWNPAAKEGTELHITLRGRGQAVQEWLEKFRKRFGA